MSASVPSPSPPKPVLTLRLAPTVTREWGTPDALLYNLMTMNVAVMFTVPFLVAMAVYPQGHLALAILIAGVFCCAEAAAYAFLASSMPRSGGDYFFQSRLLSPGVGTVFAFTGVVLGGALWMAIAGWFAAKVAVGPLLWIVGRLVGSSGLLSAAAFVQSSNGVMLLSVAVVCWAALVDLRGLRPYAGLQRVCWLIGGLAFVAVAVLVAVLGPSALGDAEPYRQAVAVARGLGYQAGSGQSALAATLALIPVTAFSLIYPAWSVQQGGELHRASSLRAQVVSIVVAEAITVVLCALLVALLLPAVDHEGLAAGSWLFFEEPAASPRPVLPFFWFFDGGFWPSGVVALSLCLLFNAWFWMWVPDITLAASRVLLAMALDRSLPRALGDLSSRRGLPLRAVLSFSAVCLIPAALFSYTGFWRLTLSVTLLNALAFAVTCAAAAALPFMDRESYRQSTAARYEVLGVPLITWCGGAFVLFTLYLVYSYAADAGLALGAERWTLLTFVAASYVLSSLLFLLVRRFRRGHEGLEVEVIYRPISGPD